jgi:hypothetical protein
MQFVAVSTLQPPGYLSQRENTLWIGFNGDNNNAVKLLIYLRSNVTAQRLIMKDMTD